QALALVLDLKAKRSGAAALEVAAEVLVGRGRIEDGARLLGAARALRSRMGLSSDEAWRRIQAELTDRLLAALGSEVFDRLAGEGGELAFEAAIREARRLLAAGGSKPETMRDADAAAFEAAGEE